MSRRPLLSAAGLLAVHDRRVVLLAAWGALVALAAAGGGIRADDPLPDARPVPRMQVEPQAGSAAAIVRGGQEISRYHFAADQPRPFLFPLVGPSGRSLTRIGHPHDPHGHSHHNSCWIAHNQVDGVDFWADRATGKVGRIVPQRVLEYVDSPDEARIVVANQWLDPDGQPLLAETRRMSFRPWDDDPAKPGQWLLVIDLRLTAVDRPRTLGKTPFGLLGVRMAKTIGVHDGGGRILNSAGGRNEAQVFWKPAKWVDYAGPITSTASEGITLMDHPKNPGHPNPFHVRDDGWMGVTTTFAEARTLQPDQPLELRYGLWIHAGVPPADAIEPHFQAFAQLP